MVVGAYYRPPVRTDEEYLSKSYDAISALRAQHKNAVFILGGDFNLPNIDWPNHAIDGHAYPRRVSQTYLDMGHDLSLEQMVDFSTRRLNTLDLLFSSHPAFMTQCRRLPPLGDKADHDMILYETSHQVVRSKQPRRTILLWKDINPDTIKNACSDLCKNFLTSNFTSINDMWLAFKTGIHDILKKHVPTKTSSSRRTNPWITTQTRRLSRRKAKAYRKAKKKNMLYLYMNHP